ncbi:glycoside hydrolase family 3 N-terminal domain-containing protein [uncultured Thomasclavelia sp.]|uniref:glycoside hydrolase family 3 N-terminal domain-containing protein n=1 Tax=uncultured Thomasclavelia sp. TaxID=3025759 RepID=UPI0025996E97|nr:glycoside hydrolase family 3 N-terminal domain-containing protein [uncultured Thomasclavelia sp.]
MKKRKLLASSLALAMTIGATMNLSLVNAQSRIDQIMEGMTLDQKITQMIMPDFRQWQQEGETAVSDLTVLNDEVAKIIDDYDFGGVILFANNVKETEQTLKLTNDLQEAAISNKAGNGNLPLLITIDQEGGIVYRLGSGTALPGNMALGATRSVEAANDVGEVIGRELNALGINVNFAPSFDTNNNPNNPVIGLRSISSDPNLVAELGVPMMKGMQKHNVATAAKHFPGHGDTATDSHTGLPLVDKSYEELSKLELIPFQAAVDNGVDMLMTAHIQYPQIEKDTVKSIADGSEVYVPATLSDDIIKGVVREKMNFDGVVVTDAMNMDAIAKNFGEAQAVIMAIQADVDICLMPTILRSKADVAKLDTIISEVKNAINERTITEDDLNDSVRRILTLKENRGILDYADDTRTWEEKLANANEQVGSKENRDIEREVSAQAVTITKNEDNILPLRPKDGEKVLLLGAYDNELPGMELSMRRLIGENVISSNVSYESFRYNSNTTIADLKDKIDSADYVIVISEIGSAAQMEQTHWLTRVPTEVVNYANEVNKDAVVLSISKPYDVANYPNAKAVAAVYGNKGMDPTEGLTPDSAFGPNIPAGIEVIFGGHAATGKLPVDVNKFENGSFSDEVVYSIGYGLTYDAVDIADKTALKIAIELANAITDKDLEKVIPVVANEFKAARDEANVIYNTASATQDEVNAAFDRLASVMQKLEFYVGDKTALKAFIDKVSDLDSTKYTETTWTQFDGALTAANGVYNDVNAMQPEVNEAYTNLVTAFLNLRLIPDKSLLEDLINQAEGLNSANYTKASFDGLTKALNEAKAVYENPNATQEEVDNAKATLEKAIAGLQANPSTPSNVDNTVNTPVNNGDTTVSVKTGDDALVGTLAGLALLSIAGAKVLRKKED